jgi:hypothetical protein
MVHTFAQLAGLMLAAVSAALATGEIWTAGVVVGLAVTVVSAAMEAGTK